MRSMRHPDPEAFLKPAHGLAGWSSARLATLSPDEIRNAADDFIRLFDNVLAFDLTRFDTVVDEASLRLAGDEEAWRVSLESVESMLLAMRSTSAAAFSRALSVACPDVAPGYLRKEAKARSHLEEIRASIAMLLGDEEREHLYADVIHARPRPLRAASKSLDLSLD